MSKAEKEAKILEVYLDTINKLDLIMFGNDLKAFL
jgi:hypothetical protein